MTLSVIIPTFSKFQNLTDMALALAKAIKPMCDELVITEDAGGYSEELKSIASIYLWSEVRGGHGVNLNRGFQASSGDFVAFIDSDITILEGDLRDLCIPGKIVSPGNKGWFIVAPRNLIEEFPPRENEGHMEGIDYW